jgi:hypothetical protein
VIDDTLPGGARRRVIEHAAPFALADREDDYRIAWAHFRARAMTSAGATEPKI